VTSKFGPGMEARAHVTVWNPPRMFAAQGEGFGGMPPIATEWSIEARAGGVCLVRVVHSLFAGTDDWNAPSSASSWLRSREPKRRRGKRSQRRWVGALKRIGDLPL
jgi:hypothetical protein